MVRAHIAGVSISDSTLANGGITSCSTLACPVVNTASVTCAGDVKVYVCTSGQYSSSTYTPTLGTDYTIQGTLPAGATVSASPANFNVTANSVTPVTVSIKSSTGSVISSCTFTVYGTPVVCSGGGNPPSNNVIDPAISCEAPGGIFDLGTLLTGMPIKQITFTINGSDVVWTPNSPGGTLNVTLQPGNNTWNWTEIDNNNVTTTGTLVIVYTVPAAPTFTSWSATSLDGTTQKLAAGTCSVAVPHDAVFSGCPNLAAPTYTSDSPINSSTLPVGTWHVTASVTDSWGHTVTKTITVTVQDVTPPVPDVSPLADATGQCSVTLTAPTATDDCAGKITGTTTDPLTYNVQGTYTVTWTYDDKHGNTVTQTQNVIVKDTTKPVPDVASLPDVTGECSATITSAPTATDNCAGVLTGKTTDPLSYNTQGTHVVTWTYDDGNGNQTTQTQNVVVKDDIAPVPDAASLADVTGECSATVTAVPTATDNCSGAITGTTTDPLTYSTQGTHTITWNFDDGHGNVSHQTQNVVIKDDIAPVAPTLADVSGECSATVSVPTTTDNCAGTVTGTTSDPLTYTAQGDFVVHWTFSDGHGNSTTVNQNVHVHDVTPPVAPVLADVSGECSASVTAPTAVDNCSGVVVGTTSDPTSYTAQGDYVVHWAFNDGHGNTSFATQNVHVHDVTPPTISGFTVSNVSYVAGTCGGSITFSASAADNCSSPAPVFSINGNVVSSPLSLAAGTYTLNVDATDAAGNKATTQSATVTVVDQPITLSGVVYNDHNTNGAQDTGDAGVAGVTVTLKSGATTVATTTTGANGAYSFTVAAGSYTVSVAPAAPWYATTATSASFNLACGLSGTANFGEVSIGNGYALSLGFWSSKNGATVFNANSTANVLALAGDKLRDAKGGFVSLTTQSAFASFETSATATNMANMLSAQMAAVHMDVVNNSTQYGLHIAGGANAIVYAPGTTSANGFGFAKIGDLLNEANAELGSYPGGIVTPAANVAHQTLLKNVFDSICNNKIFVQ